MKSLPKNWKNMAYNPDEVEELQKELKINPIFCQLLNQRGIKTYQGAKDFFRPAWEHLHAPFLMKGMNKAVQRLVQAIVKKEKVVIYGDYDVDGTTAVALVYNFLKDYHPELSYYIPDRYKEGYGLSSQGVEWAAAQNAKLMLVLDCGIKAHQSIALANKKELDVIICDHHLPAETLPEAYAILNPKQKDCPYPYKELSGCAIGFKLMQAFAEYMAIEEEKLKACLDLVAISLACDFVPLTGENRVLMHFGLQKLNTKPCLGISLLKKALDRGKNYTVRDIVFGIGPPINAAGRLAHASLTVELLIAQEEAKATDLAMQLISKNDERRELDNTQVKEAHALVEVEEELLQQKTLVLYQANWHKGVLGIVAARMVDSYYKPSIILTLSGNEIVGSARTAGDFDIHKALVECQDLLVNFGGHKHAAGLTLKPAQLAAFIARFEQVVAAQITAEEENPIQKVDALLELKEIDNNFWNILKQFEPFGPQNMRPVFVSQGVKDAGYTKLIKDEHLKLELKQNGSKKVAGIAFRMAGFYDKIKTKKPFDICYVIEENHYNNKTTLQLNLRDIVME